MKNVYARFSYATRRDGQVYDPYVQLMPITNIEDAHNDWGLWYAKWGGSSSQPSSIPAVHSTPTPSPSSLSIPPSPSSFHSSSFHSSSLSFSPSVSSSSSSSASNPLATGGNNRIAGAVEDDNTKQNSDPVRPSLFPSPISAYLIYLSGQTLLSCHHRWLGPWWPCSHRWHCVCRDEDPKRS